MWVLLWTKAWQIQTKNSPFSMESACLGVSISIMYLSYSLISSSCIYSAGLKVKCKGNPGHGSRFIEGTAAEKLQYVINQFLDFRQKEKDRLESNPDYTLGDVTTVNLTRLEVCIYYCNINSECT